MPNAHADCNEIFNCQYVFIFTLERVAPSQRLRYRSLGKTFWFTDAREVSNYSNVCFKCYDYFYFAVFILANTKESTSGFSS